MSLRAASTGTAFIGATLLLGFFLSAPLSAQEAEQQPKTQSNRTEVTPAAPPPATADQLERSAEPSLGPDTLQATRKAEERYADIAHDGGWPSVPKSAFHKPNEKTIRALRRRLAVEGDLTRSAIDRAEWDDELTAALKRFQFRMGIAETGQLSKATLSELNIPARVRADQLAATVERLSERHYRFDHRYVLVNIPAAQAEAVEDGKVVDRYTVIVGKADHPSPEVVAKIVAVKLNPSWTVPVSIIKNELIPKLRRNRSYLRRIHMRVFDAHGHEMNPAKIHWSKNKAERYTFRQDPGEKNSLGHLRISMPNKYDVYLHDTPTKKLFARNYRFLSHGCVRVEDVYQLAAWLLQGARGAPSGHWDRQTILQEIDEGARKDIRLAHPVETIWVYMTGWATADGVVHFRHDIYRLDRREDAQAKL